MRRIIVDKENNKSTDMKRIHSVGNFKLTQNKTLAELNKVSIKSS